MKKNEKDFKAYSKVFLSTTSCVFSGLMRRSKLRGKSWNFAERSCQRQWRGRRKEGLLGRKTHFQTRDAKTQRAHIFIFSHTSRRICVNCTASTKSGNDTHIHLFILDCCLCLFFLLLFQRGSSSRDGQMVLFLTAAETAVV